MNRLVLALLAMWTVSVASPASVAAAETTGRVLLSGRAQTVHLYKTANAPRAVVVLSSGDLGWKGLVVDVAEFLQSQGVGVLGLSSRAYLASFTDGGSVLDPALIPEHYETLARTARQLLGAATPAVLIGVSEGAGLSAVAAADAGRHPHFGGVIGIGLPESIELGWNSWKDWTIWITKGNPNQPHMSVAPHVGQMAPLPLIMVQSTRDEFVPPEETRGLFAAAHEPKRLYQIDAKNHRFSDKQAELRAAVLDALGWIEGLSR